MPTALFLFTRNFFWFVFLAGPDPFMLSQWFRCNHHFDLAFVYLDQSQVLAKGKSPENSNYVSQRIVL